MPNLVLRLSEGYLCSISMIHNCFIFCRINCLAEESSIQTFNDNGVVIANSDLTPSNKKCLIRVLHVDDAPCFLEVSKEILSSENNFEIEIATSVDEAIRKMESRTYDAIVSDYEMPQKSGLDFLRELREQKMDIPFILFTGKGREEVVVKALNLGADRYIDKCGSTITVYCELADAIIKATEHNKQNRISLESEHRFREMTNFLPGIVFESDINGNVLFANERAPDISGYSFEDLNKGLNIFQFIDPKDREKAAESIQRLAFGGNYIPTEYTFIRKDGTTFPALVAANPIISKNKVIGLRGFVLDISERKKAEDVLFESEEKFRKAFLTSPDAFYIATLNEGRILEANDRFEEVFGYTRTESIGKTSLELGLWANPLDRQKIVSKLRSDGQVRNLEVFGVRKDGQIFPVQISISVVQANNKQLILGIVRDISSYKKTENELRASKEKYISLFNSIDEGFCVIEKVSAKIGEPLDFLYVEVNAAFGVQSGITDVVGKTIRQVVPSEAQTWLEIYDTVLRTGKPIRFERVLSTKERILELYAFRVEDGTNCHVGVIFKDVTQRKKTEDALVESEKRSRAIVANAPIGIATSDVDRKFLSANEAFCKILGYTEDELRKLTFKDITYQADLRESFLKMAELEAGSVSCFAFEKRYIKKDGTVITGKIIVSAVRDQDGKPNLFVAELEDITEGKKAEERRVILERKVNDYSKNMKYLVDLRTAQLKDANERIIKSERLAAIGELAGMVGHDLRNPLASIKMAAYYLRKRGKAISETQVKETLDTVDKAINRSDKIINDLLDYAKEMHLELTKYAAHTLVDEALRLIQVSDKVKIVNKVDLEAWIWVNPDKMTRVFINLIKNAVDAIPENGTVEISSYQTRDHVELIFTDTGTGIPEETLPRLFVPLFTTKAQGMGFGLAICKRIIEAHDGTIAVKTELNKGTTFTITLPLKEKAAA
jgi:PAS domain S-box-containing protein